MKSYGRLGLGQPIPKQQFKCKHVKAGFLTAARVEMDKGIVHLCSGCYADYQQRGQLRLTVQGDVIQ